VEENQASACGLLEHDTVILGMGAVLEEQFRVEVANKTDGRRDREAKTQYKATKMVNKRCEKAGRDLNMTLMSTLIAPFLATCSPCLERYYLACDSILGGL
jgi:hypothetical protein